MKPEEFTAFEDEKPEGKKWIIVTNNIKAENAYGEMSHVWLTDFISVAEISRNGIVTFNDDDRMIINLTHWKYV